MMHVVIPSHSLIGILGGLRASTVQVYIGLDRPMGSRGSPFNIPEWSRRYIYWPGRLRPL